MSRRAEIKALKGGCWASRWRCVGRDPETGKPRWFVPLTRDEMFMVVARGTVSIPEHDIPAAAIEANALQEA